MTKALAIIALMSLPLASCTRASTGAEHSYTHHGVLRVELNAIPINLNPLYAQTTLDVFLAGLQFNVLVNVDAHGQEVPELAARVPTLENGDISRDGKTIVYHLRRNVRWQDGAPFTSEDVKFSWQAVMNPNNNVVERRGYDVVNTVDTPDPYTVTFHLKQAFSPFVDTVFGISDDPYEVVPKHLLAKYSSLNNVPFNAMPVGTGPFRLVRWSRGNGAEYVANDDYFGGKPGLRKIIVRFVTDDNTRGLEMRAHEADLAIQLSPTVYRSLSADPEVRTIHVVAPWYNALAFNLTHPPLDDLNVRRAIAYGLDRAGIARDCAFGTGEIATEDLSPYYWAYDPHVPSYAFDPAKAAALLDAAGWKRGADGVRAKNGEPLALVLAYVLGDPTYSRLAVLVQSQLHALGIAVQTKPYPTSLLYAPEAVGGILTGGKFDLALSPWVAGADPDDSQQWMSKYVPPAGWNLERFRNADMDAAETAALTSFDRATRKEAYARTQTILAEQLPAVFLYYQDSLSAASPDLRGYTSTGVTSSWNVAHWSI